MGAFLPILGLALATHAVSVEGYPLRSACDANSAVVANLHEGDPAEIRFALAGSGCYKIAVTSGGEELQGYVSADGITDIDQFEQGRRTASTMDLPVMLQSDVDSVRKSLDTSGSGDAGIQAARLLDQNKPNQALKVIQVYLKTNQKDPGALSLAGYAAYRSDMVNEAVQYFRASLDLQENPAVERLLTVAEREAAEDQSSEKLFGSQFLLRYNRNQMAEETARRVVDMLDREYLQVAQELGCETGERIVAIAQTPDEYRRSTDAAEWSGGQYNGRIRVAIPDQSRISEETRRAFAHEIVHACLHQIGNFPTWLHEGLAQKLSGETLSSSQLAAMHRLAAAGQLPRLDRLNQTWSRMSTTYAAVAYTTALYAVDLYYKNYSGLSMRSLLQNPGMLAQVTADLDQRLRQ